MKKFSPFRRPSQWIGAVIQQSRCSSTSHGAGHDRDWTDFWSKDRPYHRSYRKEFAEPLSPRFKSRGCWWMDYGVGHYASTAGPALEMPDFEFSDGTPIPMNSQRYGRLAFNDKQIYDLISAGAIVEQYAQEGRLPRVPATKVQRDWDPNIPLFLEDSDERGLAPGGSVDDLPPVSLPSLHGEEAVTYDPDDFIQEHVPHKEYVRPMWNKKLWALNNTFFVNNQPSAKNTIPDE